MYLYLNDNHLDFQVSVTWDVLAAMRKPRLSYPFRLVSAICNPVLNIGVIPSPAWFHKDGGKLPLAKRPAGGDFPNPLKGQTILWLARGKARLSRGFGQGIKAFSQKEKTKKVP